MQKVQKIRIEKNNDHAQIKHKIRFRSSFKQILVFSEKKC